MAAFPCPACGSTATRVSNTERKGWAIKRYLRCTVCEHRFRTLETAINKPSRNRPKPTPMRGSRNGRSILTEADVLAIRQLAAAGVPVRTIAARFGFSPSHIARIASGKRWRHLKADVDELPALQGAHEGDQDLQRITRDHAADAGVPQVQAPPRQLRGAARTRSHRLGQQGPGAA